MSGQRCAASLLTLMLVIAAGPLPVVRASSARDQDAAADPCLLQLRTAIPRVTLQLVDRVRLSADARTEMMRETVELWRAAGVDVEWSKLPAAGSTVDVAMTDASHPQVKVIVTRDMPEMLPAAPSTVRVMASILFVENRPTTLIGAYPAEVERLLDTMHTDAGSLGERPAALRQRLMGRVLGRAIAHELGHYLFGSSDHAPKGLMRARHRVDDLTSPFRRAFRVIPSGSSAVGCGATRGSW